MNKREKLFLALAILIHIFLFLCKNYLVINPRIDSFQQENFSDYALSLKSGIFPQGLDIIQTANYPGLPFLIYGINFFFGNIVLTGLFISLLSLYAIYYFSLKFTKNPIYSLWITLFPPIVFELTSKLSTETLAIAISFLFLSLFYKRKYFLASFICGYGFIVRLILICPFLAMILFFVKEKKFNKIFPCFLLFMIFPLLMTFFNVSVWGIGGAFYQSRLHMQIAGSPLVILQLIRDVLRVLNWGQGRILISGVFYVLVSFFLLFLTLKKKGDFLLKNDSFFVKSLTILMIIFIYSLGPIPVLEEIRRFLAVFFPFIFLENYKEIIKLKKLFYSSFILLIIAFF